MILYHVRSQKSALLRALTDARGDQVLYVWGLLFY